MRHLFIILFVGFLLLGCEREDLQKYTPNTSLQNWEQFERQTFIEINILRDSLGLNKLIRDEFLRGLSEERAIYYHNQGFIDDHIGFFPEYTNRIKDKGINKPSEMLGYGYTQPYSLVRALYNSPDHNAILLSSSRDIIGIGFKEGFTSIIMGDTR